MPDRRKQCVTGHADHAGMVRKNPQNPPVSALIGDSAVTAGGRLTAFLRAEHAGEMMLCGQLVLVLPKVRRSHVVVEYGVVGVQREGFLVVLDSFVVVPILLLHVAAVVVSFRGLLVLLNGSI